MLTFIRAMIWGTTMFAVMLVVKKVFNRDCDEDVKFDVETYLRKVRNLGY
ncbi:MAG: hypothetical protein Q4F84_09940 [Fibrobacter sp.]|nr:hypothetical protein [Fibrobacter sp.]